MRNFTLFISLELNSESILTVVTKTQIGQTLQKLFSFIQAFRIKYSFNMILTEAVKYIIYLSFQSHLKIESYQFKNSAIFLPSSIVEKNPQLTRYHIM